MASDSLRLLDRRYRITTALPGYPGERHFAARHVELDIPVRIVSVRMSDWHDAPLNEAADRFWTRAEAAVALRHPGIVRVRDCFRQGHAFMLVLDWATEETLAARLAAYGPLPLREVLALGLLLCDTLGSIAQRAPVLLPLSTLAPETLSRLPNGQYGLTDLGIRHWTGNYQGSCIKDGSPFQAPERYAGVASDVRADLYSLAAVLYAALTGEPPAPLGLARMPLSVLAPAVPKVVCDTIERALRRDPADRYLTPESFGVALSTAIRRALPDLAAPVVPVMPATPTALRRAAVVPASHDAERQITRNRRRHVADGETMPGVLHWPQVWAQGLSRVAAPSPLRRTGERALAALSSALRPGA